MDKLAVILNPWAGRGLAGRQRAKLERALQAAALPFHLLTTDRAGGATALATEALAHGYRPIAVVGGDGTLNEVASAILHHQAQCGEQVPLGIVPVGTGSDFIKSLPGFAPNDIPAAVARLAGGRTWPIDAGRICVSTGSQQHSHYFINNLALGIDAHVAAETQQLTRLKGLAAYLVGALRALARYQPQPVTLRFGTTELVQSFLLATVANGRCQGGGFWLTPDAQLDDGQFDLCLVAPLRPTAIIRYLPLAMRGKHTTLPRVHMATASQVDIAYTRPALVVTDGEVIATVAQRVQVELLPQTLAVIV